LTEQVPYQPRDVFGGDGSVPRALIAPARYVQGPGVLERLGRYLSLLPGSRAGLLLSPGGAARFGDRIGAALRAEGISASEVEFGGECSIEEIERIAAALGGAAPTVDYLVAVGGGKCIDAGRAAARRLGLPVAVCPSLASTDAPCAALSVIYSSRGVKQGVEFFPDSPALVAVDSEVVAQAPPRYLVAGMGDAMATWYEARTCVRNPDARSLLGGRPTIAAAALGELCAHTLFANGVAAAEAVRRGEVTEPLERVIEANTLLSGIGFESGGIAAAHSVVHGLTAIDAVRENHMHGEMVAIGLLTQLVLEGTPREARRVAAFCAAVGLPVHLGQISLSPDDGATLATVMEAAMTLPFVANEPFEVSAASLARAAADAHALGVEITRQRGDEAYRSLREA
jgi:glycerol dehydrogenase